jgi:hypothetical protein
MNTAEVVRRFAPISIETLAAPLIRRKGSALRPAARSTRLSEPTRLRNVPSLLATWAWPAGWWTTNARALPSRPG